MSVASVSNSESFDGASEIFDLYRIDRLHLLLRQGGSDSRDDFLSMPECLVEHRRSRWWVSNIEARIVHQPGYRLHTAIAIGRVLESKSRQTLQVGRRFLEPLALEDEQALNGAPDGITAQMVVMAMRTAHIAAKIRVSAGKEKAASGSCDPFMCVLFARRLASLPEFHTGRIVGLFALVNLS